jgi:hypothetical protein
VWCRTRDSRQGGYGPQYRCRARPALTSWPRPRQATLGLAVRDHRRTAGRPDHRFARCRAGRRPGGWSVAQLAFQRTSTAILLDDFTMRSSDQTPLAGVLNAQTPGAAAGSSAPTAAAPGAGRDVDLLELLEGQDCRVPGCTLRLTVLASRFSCRHTSAEVASIGLRTCTLPMLSACTIVVARCNCVVSVTGVR